MKPAKANKPVKVKIVEAKWLVHGALTNSWKSHIIKRGGGHEKM